MGGFQVKNLCQKAGGRFYYRRKVAGRDEYIRLPSPLEPGFAAAYAEAAHEGEREKPTDGSIAALVAAYRASSDFRSIPSAVTRANDSRYLDLIVAEHGHRSVSGVRPANVRKMRDRYQDTPGKAHNWLRVFKTLMKYAAENDWRSDNPAQGITPPRLGEREPWPADVLERALAAASPMTRLAIILGLCTGARIGDAIRIQHNWHDGSLLQFAVAQSAQIARGKSSSPRFARPAMFPKPLAPPASPVVPPTSGEPMIRYSPPIGRTPKRKRRTSWSVKRGDAPSKARTSR